MIIILFSAICSAQSADGPQPTAAMGKELFEQPGTSACLFCHGKTGTGGRVPNAGNLREPKTWKAWKALGGDAVYATNKIDFLLKLKTATVSLIENGSIKHNADFKPPWFHWDQIESYNALMMGLQGASAQAWLEQFPDKGMTPHIAVEALWLHLQTLDSQGVLTNSP